MIEVGRGMTMCSGRSLCLLFGVFVAGILSAEGAGRSPSVVTLEPGESLRKACDDILAARRSQKIGKDEPATVVLKPGRYCLKETFVVRSCDGGSSEAGAVTFKAEKPGTVEICGGVTVPRNLFALADGRPGVLVADVSSLLPEPLDEWPDVNEEIPPGPWLYRGGRPLTLARWPNAGWATFTNAVDQGANGPGAFRFDHPRLRQWDVSKGVWMMGYWTHDWADAYLRVQSIDPASNVVRFAGKTRFGVGGKTWGEKERRFYVVNALSELDSPDEWFLDRKQKRLYWMPSAEHEGEELVLASFGRPLVVLEKGVKHMRFENIDFAYSHSTNAAFAVVDGSDVVISNCSFRCLADFAVSIDGTDVRVVDCRMKHIGGSVALVRGGNRRWLLNACNSIERCDISDFGFMKRTYRPGVDLRDGCGNALRECHIHDSPYIALWYGGNECLVSDNNIHDVDLEAADSAAVYTGKDTASWGNVLFGNSISRLKTDSPLTKYRMGLYIDDVDCGDWLIENDVRDTGVALLIGGGNGNVILRNRFRDSNKGIDLDSRGCLWPTIKNHLPGGMNSWHQQCSAYDYRVPPWSVAYPRLAQMVDDEPNVPWMNAFVGNAVVNCGKAILFDPIAQHARRRMDYRDNIVTNALPEGRMVALSFRDAKTNILRSPDGRLVATYFLDVAGRLSWRCDYDGVPLVARSPLGLTVDDRDYGRLVIPGAATTVVTNGATSMSIPLTDLVTGDQVVFLDVRVEARSVAHRWRIVKDGDHHVRGEFSAWILPRGEQSVVLEDVEPPEGMPTSVYFRRGKIGVQGTSFPFKPIGFTAKGHVLSPWRRVRMSDGPVN